MTCIFRIALLYSIVFIALIGAISGTSQTCQLRPRSDVDQSRADAVKEMFTTAWNGYHKYAFPMDQLKPVSNVGWNARNGWSASAIDALDTAIMMELPDIVDTILSYIPTIDFTVSFENQWVSLFETTIRYIGGMLSAYDLLRGPYSHLAKSSTQVEALLSQSRTLADTMAFAFETPTGIPFNHLLLHNRSNSLVDDADGDGERTGLAVAGTLILEWTRLSDLTGDPKYGALAEKAESYLLAPRPASSEPFPGLLGTHINITSGQFIDSAGGWDGSSDSFYEYLLKIYLYNPSRFVDYKDRWITAVDSTIDHLLVHPATRPDITFLSTFNGTSLTQQMGHLSCFAGGNLIQGGLALNNSKYVDAGLAIVNGCQNTYMATSTAIGPEFWSWNQTAVQLGGEGEHPALSADKQQEFFQKHGFWIDNDDYILRPEHVESLYYAFRATANETYRSWAWDALVAINATCRTSSGFSAIENVNSPPEEPRGGGKQDNQESFLFAELLKYGWLIFASDELEVHVNMERDVAAAGFHDRWIYSTEAHPFRTQGSLPRYPTMERKVFNAITRLSIRHPIHHVTADALRDSYAISSNFTIPLAEISGYLLGSLNSSCGENSIQELMTNLSPIPGQHPNITDYGCLVHVVRAICTNLTRTSLALWTHSSYLDATASLSTHAGKVSMMLKVRISSSVGTQMWNRPLTSLFRFASPCNPYHWKQTAIDQSHTMDFGEGDEGEVDMGNKSMLANGYSVVGLLISLPIEPIMILSLVLLGSRRHDSGITLVLSDLRAVSAAYHPLLGIGEGECPSLKKL